MGLLHRGIQSIVPVSEDFQKVTFDNLLTLYWDNFIIMIYDQRKVKTSEDFPF